MQAINLGCKYKILKIVNLEIVTVLILFSENIEDVDEDHTDEEVNEEDEGRQNVIESEVGMSININKIIVPGT